MDKLYFKLEAELFYIKRDIHRLMCEFLFKPQRIHELMQRHDKTRQELLTIHPGCHREDCQCHVDIGEIYEQLLCDVSDWQMIFLERIEELQETCVQNPIKAQLKRFVRKHKKKGNFKFYY